MANTIQVDKGGALLVPSSLLGCVEPGSTFAVESHGDVVILRREPADGDRWWESTTPEQRIAWLEEWIGNLPQNPALPLDAIGRDSIYD